MTIIIDAMGGDNAPLAPLMGARQAADAYGVDIIAVGDEKQLRQTAEQHGISLERIAIQHAGDVVAMDDDATDVMKKKPDSSVAVALRLLAEGRAGAVVSAGSTGALLVGATLIVKRIRGIKRAALATVMPGLEKPWMLLDCGANVECRPEMLVQFGVMGSAYMEKVMGVKEPRVGLINNGSEEGKGTRLQQDAHAMLKRSGLNFMGNVEARDLPFGKADVAVADGFTGNIVLKLTEGVAKMFSGKMKDMFYKSAKTKLAGLMMKGAVADFRKSFDYTEYGGAPLLGISKPVIKAHGSSNANAIKNAIRQAKLCAEMDVAGVVSAWVALHRQSGEAADTP